MAILGRLVLVSTLASATVFAQTPAPPPAPPGATPTAAAPAAAAPTAPATAPMSPPPYLYPGGNYPVPVDIVGTEPGLAFTISDKDGRPIAECPGNCRLQLPPGRYKVFVHATEDTLPGSRNVDITGPATVRVDPDMTGHRDAGLAMGIAGPILMLVGMVALLSTACWDCSEGEQRTHDDEHRGANTLAAVGLLGGLTITPIGWVMYGTSFKPEIDVTTGGAPGAPAAAGLRRSPSFGAMITF